MRNTTIGILAHVDAGKTTLSESILYLAGAVRRRGRVDHGDAFLDTDAMEKKRGITIYSKLARFEYSGRPFTILDTPGHSDFSPEMERALQVLDAAILVISAADTAAQKGADPQVKVLWKLLRHYRIPVFIFINKLDQLRSGEWQQGILQKNISREKPENEQELRGKNPKAAEAGRPAAGDDSQMVEKILDLLTRDLGEGLVFFGKGQLTEQNEEAAAVCDETLMEKVLEGGHVTGEDVQRLVAERKLFPVYAGSALLNEGTQALLDGIAEYVSLDEEADIRRSPADGEGAAFGAKVYKITREAGTRLTWMKITDGTLKVRDVVQQCVRTEISTAPAGTEEEKEIEEETAREKISELRLYSGDRYELVTEVCAGEIVAAAGLSYTRAGDGLGTQRADKEELLAPILTCSVTAVDRFGKQADKFTLMNALRELEEQEPMLQVSREETGDITVRIMGAIQIEILKNLLKERYDLRAEFGPGTIVYQETIRRPVEGVGHFEPLRHYAEVHLLLEPGEAGSGITFENRCIPNMLDRNWQNLILSQLSSGNFRGVLTGAGLTDVHICLLGGRANKKHTSGGDFRKAAFAAVRQGLMMAQNILLEPVLNVTMELPAENLGRAMTDISQMHGSCRPAVFQGENAVLEGAVPASEWGDYAAEAAGYTGGRAHVSVSFKGYEPCHNAREVMEEKEYDPDADRRNPTWSVFCSHGAGTIVPWNRVREFMHVDCGWQPEPEELSDCRSEDYFTYSPKDSGELYDIDRLTEEEETADPQGDRSVRRKKQTDYRDRERARLTEEEELRRIFEKTYGPVKQQLRHPDNERKSSWVSGSGLVLPSEEGAQLTDPAAEGEGGTCSGKEKSAEMTATEKPDSSGAGGKRRAAAAQKKEAAEEFLLVDGYNIIFAWAELKDLASSDIKSARDRLMEILSDYAGYTGENVIVVFDAYRVAGGKGEVYRYHNIDVIYTKEAETADLYIEKTAHKLSRRHRVRVATGDFVEQVIIFGSGATRLSPRGLLEEILYAGSELKERYVK